MPENIENTEENNNNEKLIPGSISFDQDAYTLGIKILIYKKYKEIVEVYPDDWETHYPNKKMLEIVQSWEREGFNPTLYQNNTTEARENNRENNREGE